jgi:hypothetical protein
MINGGFDQAAGIRRTPTLTIHRYQFTIFSSRTIEAGSNSANGYQWNPYHRSKK